MSLGYFNYDMAVVWNCSQRPEILSAMPEILVWPTSSPTTNNDGKYCNTYWESNFTKLLCPVLQFGVVCGEDEQLLCGLDQEGPAVPRTALNFHLGHADAVTQFYHLQFHNRSVSAGSHYDSHQELLNKFKDFVDGNALLTPKFMMRLNSSKAVMKISLNL